MESALPTVMGRAYDSTTGQTITLAFDPMLELRENTVDNPIPDGGGSNYLAMAGWWDGLGWLDKNSRFFQPVNDGATHCANVRRNFLNEKGCECIQFLNCLQRSLPYSLHHNDQVILNAITTHQHIIFCYIYIYISGRLSFSPTACTQPNGKGMASVIHNDKAVVVCGSPGETANDYTLGTVDGFSLKSWIERPARREVYKEGVFREQRYNVWFHVALRSADQLRQRVAWALYQIAPVAIVPKPGFVARTEVWVNYYDVYTRNAFGNYWNVLKEVGFIARAGFPF